MRAVLDVVFVILDLYIWVLIIQAVLSWLLAFNVLNARNQLVGAIWRFTVALTEPLLKPIRNVVRPINGLDLSPLILMLGIFLLQRVLAYYVYPNVF
jgi:YggT family protein